MAVEAGVTIDRAQLVAVLRELYGDAYLAGSHVAAKLAGGSVVAALTDIESDVDWGKWSPGWGEAAAKDASGGLARLLAQAEVTIRGITDSALDRLGDTLAAGIKAGDSGDTIAAAMRAQLADPKRCELVTRTEVARAMTAASMDTYAENGVELVQMLTADPCPECEALADETANGVTIDQAPQPPIHPNCRCSLAPVIGAGNEE